MTRGAALAVVLVATAACSTEDDVLPAELTPTMACSEAASYSDVIGDGRKAELVRAERTTGSGLAQWLAVRHGPGGPSQSAAPTIDPRDPIDVCVFRGEPRSISMPEGATVDTTGVRVFVGFGGVTLDAVGDADRLARDLDSLR